MGKGQETTRMVAIMTKFKLPDYYNYQKENPKEILVERKCNMCGKLAKMDKFDRYCSPNCRSVATRLDNTNYSVRFR